MSHHMSIQNPVWLIGTGNMAREYAKVLRALEVPFQAIGRSESGTAKFIADTGAKAVSGGLSAFLSTSPALPPFAINAVQAELGSDCICTMLQYGVKRILAEKPTGMSVTEIQRNAETAKAQNAQLIIGYNRRFYASTEAARKIIAADGGVTSFHFEFTELYRVIGQLTGDVSGWFYGNSTHVCDLAFALGGSPAEMCSFAKRDVDGYTSTVIYAGAGVSETGALFSYDANYLAPGRWSVEMMTKQHRLIFRPMEQLQVQNLGSFAIEPYEIDDRLDKEFKPGLYMQVKTFMENPEDERLLTIEGQLANMRWYARIHEGNALCDRGDADGKI